MCITAARRCGDLTRVLLTSRAPWNSARMALLTSPHHAILEARGLTMKRSAVGCRTPAPWGRRRSILPIVGAAPAGCSAATRASVTPKAIIFDVFGTVVDWRSSIVADATAWGKAKGIQHVDWMQFAVEWRQGQGREMSRVRRGELPWTKLDDLHRQVLDGLITKFNITGLTDDDKDHWNRVWHRLTPWPDSIPGLTRLKKKYTIAPLSNGNFMMTNSEERRFAVGLHSLGRIGEHFK